MQVQDIDPAFGHWLAGFIDGEGCFIIQRKWGWTSYQCRLTVGLRADDEPILREIAHKTGCGRLSKPDRGRYAGHAQVIWHVSARTDCVAMIDWLDRFPLRAKKARDYATWREAVLLWATTCHGGRGPAARGRNQPTWERMGQLQEQLVAGRLFADLAA